MPIDPGTAYLIATGPSTLGGMLLGGDGDGGRTGDEKFYSARKIAEERELLGQQRKFNTMTEEDRLKLLKQQTILGQLNIQQGQIGVQAGELGLERQQFGNETATDLRGRLQSYADAPGFDTSSLQRGLLSQFNQQSKNTRSSFAQRGFGGSGAERGALANQFSSQMAVPMAQLQQQSFANQRSNQLGALGQLGGLT